MFSTALIATIRDGIDAFTCDFTHEYLQNGQIVVDVYCEGDHDDCSYCATVRAAAKEAEQLAEEAIAAVSAGNFSKARELIERAAKVELEFGDCPAYQPAVEALRAV